MPAKYKFAKNEIEEMKAMHLDPKIKIDKICKKFRVSDDTVARAMRRYGVPMRVTVSTDVHYWDRSYRNNSPGNLVLLCPNHHREAYLGIITKDNFKEVKKKNLRGGPVVG